MKPNYRYGYQGSEKENEIHSGGYSTEYRILDVRIGRWFSTDPITHPWQSPYCSMDNNPVALNDVLGLSAQGSNTKSNSATAAIAKAQGWEVNDEKNSKPVALGVSEGNGQDYTYSTGSNESKVRYTPPKVKRKGLWRRIVACLTKKYVIDIEPGIFTVDFTSKNGDMTMDGDYKLNGQPLPGVKNDFTFYDSKQNWSPVGPNNKNGPFTDQQNKYWITLRRKNSQNTLTFGLTHYKGEQTPDGPGNQFRFGSGGGGLTVLFGFQSEKQLGDGFSMSFNYKFGGYISREKLQVNLIDNALGVTIYGDNPKRTFAGGGLLYHQYIAFDYKIGNHYTVSLGCSLNMLGGYVFSRVSVTQNDTGVTSGFNNTLSKSYFTMSFGPFIRIRLR